MATMFTVRLSKDSGKRWNVNLGVDILEGMSDAMIRSLAEQSQVINIQNGIRRKVKADDGEAIEKYLQENKFPEATVTELEVTESNTALTKRLLAKYTKEELMELLGE